MPEIPAEILHEIFRQSLSEPLRAHRAATFPWYLGHICSQWRALFFSMRSTFWSEIEIQVWTAHYFNDPERFKHMHEIVVFFLDCTQGAPFSFTFCVEDDFVGRDFYGFCSILMELIERSAQWEEVSLQLESFVGFLWVAKGRLPLLKKLEIIEDTYYRPQRGEIRQSIVANLFGEAPRLTHVILWDNSPFVQFNWSSLTIVHFHYTIHRERVVAALRETINLVELIIDGYVDGSGDGSIRLPHLECLSVSGVGLLTTLETPALRRLKIDFSLDLNFTPEQAGITVSFLRRSEIRLSTLVIKDIRATFITEILPFVLEVKELALIHVPDIANVFKWLAGTGEQEVQINSLTVIWDELTSINPMVVAQELAALRYMIACQNPRSPSPKTVIIQTPGEGQGAAAKLKLVCRERRIPFGFAEEMPTLVWGI